MKKLTQEEKQELISIKNLLESKDFESIELGYNLFKRSKIKSRLKNILIQYNFRYNDIYCYEDSLSHKQVSISKTFAAYSESFYKCSYINFEKVSILDKAVSKSDYYINDKNRQKALFIINALLNEKLVFYKLENYI